MAVNVTRSVIISCTSAMDSGARCFSDRREWMKKPIVALTHMAANTTTA